MDSCEERIYNEINHEVIEKETNQLDIEEQHQVGQKNTSNS
jgi:hypothetical protein